MTRLAVEIARCLPALEHADEDKVRDLVDGWTAPGLPPLNARVHNTVAWARETERVIATIDADTCDRMFETIDRFRARVVR